MTDAPTLNADWLSDPGVRRVIAAFAASGLEARFVGGCVRNALLDEPVGDLDLAVGVPPDESTRILEAAGIRVAPTGFEHGTVTAVVEDAEGGHQGLEITSLRRDVETDGRRAVVSFTTDWAEDAARRDFTMNALYASAEGRVFDPLGDGLDDLAARRVRFIGVAEDRIREDYLRILRFFRFIAWYGRGAVDADGLAASTRLEDGLLKLPRERIGQETRKLLAAPDPSAAIAAMAECGVLERTLEGARAEATAPLIAAEAGFGARPCWRRRLAALFAAPGEPVARLAQRLDPKALTQALRLSRADLGKIAALRDALPMAPGEAAWRLGLETAEDALMLRQALGAAATDVDRAAARTGAEARLPVSAGDLIAIGVTPGPDIGAALSRAERAWIDSGFALDKAALLDAAASSRRSD